MIIKEVNEINLIKTFFSNNTVLWQHEKVVMNSAHDEDTLLLLLAVCICQTVILRQLPFKKRKKHKMWVMEWKNFSVFSEHSEVVLQILLHWFASRFMKDKETCFTNFK